MHGKYMTRFKGKYFSGQVNKFGVPEVTWHGTQLNQPDWDDAGSRCLAMTLGDTDEDSDGLDNVHIMMNMYWEPLQFEIPQYEGLKWQRLVDTSLPSPNDVTTRVGAPVIADSTYIVNDRSIVVLATMTSAYGGQV
jgi:glycogen operon protein